MKVIHHGSITGVNTNIFFKYNFETKKIKNSLQYSNEFESNIVSR